MDSPYILWVEHKGEEYPVSGMTIEGCRKRAQQLYPGSEEVKFEDQKSFFKGALSHE